MPKLVIASSSDEFFLNDDSHYFFDDLPGEKYIWWVSFLMDNGPTIGRLNKACNNNCRLLENSGHGIGGSPLNEDYWQMLGTYSLSVLNVGAVLPLVWSESDNTQPRCFDYVWYHFAGEFTTKFYVGENKGK